ncbi:MAG: hypothetical protein ACHQAY_21665, partial [Hyphomicrobiales bacterium]
MSYVVARSVDACSAAGVEWPREAAALRRSGLCRKAAHSFSRTWRCHVHTSRLLWALKADSVMHIDSREAFDDFRLRG